jgi:hypothetical protein
MADTPHIADEAGGPTHSVLKNALIAAGRRLSGSSVMNLQAAMNYLWMGNWMSSHGFTAQQYVDRRQRVWSIVADRIRDKQRVLFIELGVFRGASMLAWTKLLTQPEARFVGFDTFQGMPESFDERTGIGEGAFDVRGAMPDIRDPRVQFIAGMIEDTLPAFPIPPHDQLVLSIDCDLYNPTVVALEYMHPHIKPGTIINFDDMAQPLHEPRAFSKYLREHQRQFTLLADDRQGHCAFECIR